MGMFCHDAFLLSAPFRYPDGEEQYMTTMKAKKEQHPKMLPCWQSHGVHSHGPVFAHFNSMKGFAIFISTWLHRRLELIFAIQPQNLFPTFRFALFHFSNITMPSSCIFTCRKKAFIAKESKKLLSLRFC